MDRGEFSQNVKVEFLASAKVQVRYIHFLQYIRFFLLTVESIFRLYFYNVLSAKTICCQFEIQ